MLVIFLLLSSSGVPLFSESFALFLSTVQITEMVLLGQIVGYGFLKRPLILEAFSRFEAPCLCCTGVSGTFTFIRQPHFNRRGLVIQWLGVTIKFDSSLTKLITKRAVYKFTALDRTYTMVRNLFYTA